EDGIRDWSVTGVQTCALPIYPVYEPPTCRILDRCMEDERRHIAAGETIIQHLATTPDVAARVESWQRTLQDLLEAARGVTGQGQIGRASCRGRGGSAGGRVGG